MLHREERQIFGRCHRLYFACCSDTKFSTFPFNVASVLLVPDDVRCTFLGHIPCYIPLGVVSNVQDNYDYLLSEVL